MIEREVLEDAIRRGCTWLTDVAQIKEERVPTECPNAPQMMQKSWKGAMRGEYSAGYKNWDVFCPVWHSGQAIKALCFAYRRTGEEKWLASARMAGDFILAQQITDPSSDEYGLIWVVEDYADCVNTSAILEALDGLLVLSETTGDPRWRDGAILAARWVRDHAYLGGAHFLDCYSIPEKCFKEPDWTRNFVPPDGFEKMHGRPLADDSIFLKMYHLTGEESFRTVFFELTDWLRTHEVPAGTWNNYLPSKGKKGDSHPRQSFWWGMPMYDAYRETGNEEYLDSLRRCGEWYLHAQRLDGGMFRRTDLRFNTQCFGVCTSGISCASLLWMRLYSIDHDARWMRAVERALEFNLSVQFRDASDPNLEGAVLESTSTPNGSDRSPYNLRDIATIFFIQAAERYLALTAELPDEARNW